MKKIDATSDMTPEQKIDLLIAGTPDWRGKMMAKLRKLIHAADPSITEDWKWDIAVYVSKGNVMAVAPFKDYVKINFFKGALLADPSGLFNAGLEAKVSRAIDIAKDYKVNELALKELIRAAVAVNAGGKKK
jgi:hypothetical protein